MKTSMLILAVLAALASSASADELVLRNGSTFVGAVREEGDRVTIEMDFGTMSFRKVDVKSVIRGQDTVRDFEERCARASGSKELVDVALWGREKGLGRRADDLLQRVLKLDPDQSDARKALGFERIGGQWLKDDELQVARGFLKVDGKWLPRDSAQRQLDRQAAARLEQDRIALEARIADQKHEEEMVRLAQERERIEIERKDAERRAIELERIRIDIERARWYGDPRPYGAPTWCESLPGYAPSTTAAPAPTVKHSTSTPRDYSPIPLTPPTVLPISPPWQKPITKSTQAASKNDKKDDDEKDKEKRR